MLTDAPGSPDGIRIQQFAAGETYDVGDDLGATFLAEGLAEAPRAAAPKPPAKASKRAAPLENK